MIENMLNILWTATAILMGIGAVLMMWFYRRLRTRHFDTWLRLGQPSLFFNASMLIQKRVARFLWRRGYEELGDATLNRLARISKILAVVTSAVIVAAFLLVFRLL